MNLANFRFRSSCVLFVLAICGGFSCVNAEPYAPTPTGRVTPQATSAGAKIKNEPSIAANTRSTFSVTGKWTDTYSYQWSVSATQAGNISGLAQVYCTAPWVITGTTNGTAFILHASNPVSDQCTQWFEYAMSFTSPTTATGTWKNSAGFTGNVTMIVTENCASVINNALSGPVLSGGGILSGSTNITATFTPMLNGSPYGLRNAALLCGFANFNWIQIITRQPDPSPFFARSNGARLTSASVPFNDPPPGGGYTYQSAPDNSYPFYYDSYNGELLGQQIGGITMSFGDAPSNPCLPGPLGLPSNTWLTNAYYRNLCMNTTAPRGSFEGFTTHLAGVMPDGTAVDLGIGFTWTSTFNGTFGGLAQTKSNASVPPDAGSGEGGITITSVNPTTTYIYLGSAIHPPVLLYGSDVAVSASGFVFNRVTQTFNSTVMIKNVSKTTIKGPLQIVFSSLSSGIELINAANGFGGYHTFGGYPYATIQLPAGLAPGQLTTLVAKFRNPSNAQISFNPLIYSGSFSY